jgi:hypothetical protein
MTYRVLIDDNFHYMDESERRELGAFDTLDEAVAACKKVVDEFLTSTYRPGMTVAEMLEQYAFFGEDPFIVGGEGGVPFSARDYASRRIREICGDSSEP